jgi:FdrA protein
LAALGEGISHGIGVGGRDLSREVGGMMTLVAIEALAANPGTEAIVVISKPPHPDVMAKLESALMKLKKPVVVCSLGEPSAPNDGLTRVHSLADAADAVVMRLRGGDWSHAPFCDPEVARARLDAIPQLDDFRDRGVLGLYTGGTLAYEAHLILEPLLGEVAFNGDFRDASARHNIVDLGDDAFTVGRPHPMIAPETRTEIVAEIAAGSNVGVLILDLVLGRGAHHDPALPVAEALSEMRTNSPEGARPPMVLASVVGTPDDPQGLDRQVDQLTDAGVCVFPSNAEAARFAALLVKPELATQLLGSG